MHNSSYSPVVRSATAAHEAPMGGAIPSSESDSKNILLGDSPGQLRVREVCDADEQAANITAWYQEYDQISAGQFYGATSEIWLGRTQFFLESTNRALRQTCIVWPEAFWFGLPRYDSADAYIDIYPLRSDAISVRPGSVDFELLTPNDYDILGIVVDESVLNRYAMISDHPDLMEVLRKGEVFPISRERKMDFWRYLVRTLEELRQFSGTGGISPTACCLMEEEVVSRLLNLLADSAQADMPRRSRQNYRKVVSRAREYVLSHPNQVISIVDLCEKLHVSRRTLQNCFHEVLGICPVTYLKALRLNVVRRVLKGGASHAQTVQDVAATWGFWHMSQFAADYRNLFHELPSETLRHSRR